MDATPGQLPAPPIAKKETRRINLALQGGGTHGAFTWGALDRLLEEDRLEFDGLSGTSAGAINGAIFALGLLEGGREGARLALDRFWRALGSKFAVSPMRSTPIEKALWGWDMSHSMGWNAFETLTRLVSPYQLNPFPTEFNPLRKALQDSLDLGRLRTDKAAMRMFISATNVRTGKPKVFTRPEITVDALLASACLPTIFRAVEIDGEAYWDGGYLGNPALWPLYHDRLAVRHRAGAAQPAAAAGAADLDRRHHEPAERDQLQRLADERDARDRLRAAHAGKRAAGAAALPPACSSTPSRTRRGCASSSCPPSSTATGTSSARCATTGARRRTCSCATTSASWARKARWTSNATCDPGTALAFGGCAAPSPGGQRNA
jgi:predicted acylesterase/phospholipase RssA